MASFSAYLVFVPLWVLVIYAAAFTLECARLEPRRVLRGDMRSGWGPS